ncbi:MAG: thioredoxin family protein [Thermoanaerobaculia bacterium]
MSPLSGARVLRTLLSAFFLCPLVGLSAPAAKPVAAPLPPIYDTELLGNRELKTKVEVGQATNRRILIDFGTNDCSACRVVNKAIHEPVFFRELVKQFVPVLIDVTPGTPNAAMLKEYSIDAKKGLPAFVLLDVEGNVIEATTKGEITALAKNGKEAVQEWLLARFQKTQ